MIRELYIDLSGWLLFCGCSHDPLAFLFLLLVMTKMVLACKCKCDCFINILLYGELNFELFCFLIKFEFTGNMKYGAGHLFEYEERPDSRIIDGLI